MNNFCVICGSIIPEGRMVCPICEKKVTEQSSRAGIRTPDKVRRRKFIKKERLEDDHYKD